MQASKAFSKELAAQRCLRVRVLAWPHEMRHQFLHPSASADLVEQRDIVCTQTLSDDSHSCVGKYVSWRGDRVGGCNVSAIAAVKRRIAPRGRGIFARADAT